MRNNRLSLAVLATTLLATMPAFANPSPGPFGPQFLPAVIVLILASSAFTFLGGVDAVMSAKYPEKDPFRRARTALVLVLLSVFVSVLIVVILAAWCLAIAIQMLFWGLRAAISRERPPHLESVRPKRMLLCAGLLIISAVGTTILGFISIRNSIGPERSPMAKAFSDISRDIHDR